MPTPAASLDPQTEWDDDLDSSAGKALSGLSGPAQTEQAGVLFQRPDGKYGRSTTIASTQHDHFKLAAQVPQGHKIAGIFHTHLGSDRNAQFFSPDDIDMANQLKVPSYIRFADGSVRKYVPGKTIIGNNWYTNPPRGDAVKTGPTEVKVKGSSMAASIPSPTSMAIRTPTSAIGVNNNIVPTPSGSNSNSGSGSSSGSSAGAGAGTGTGTVPKPPTVPSIQSLQQTTPNAQTIGATTAGAAPTATASDSGLISQAQAQNASAATINNGQIDPNDATNAASQLGAITAANSPYIQLAEQQGLISAAGRGLENSSIGAGASEAAAVQAAAPLAEQNASEATQAGLQNAQLGTQTSEFNTGENVQQAMQNAAEQTQTSQLNAQLAGQTNQFNASQTQQAAATNASAQNAMKQETMQLNSSINQQYLSGTQAEDLASIQGQFNQLIASNQAASNLYESYFSGISSTMANQNIAPSRVADTIAADQSMLSSGLQIIDEMNGMSLDLNSVTNPAAGNAANGVPLTASGPIQHGGHP